MIAGFGIFVPAPDAFLLIAYPTYVLPESPQSGYLDAWFYPVAAVGGSILSDAILLAGAAGGYYFVRLGRASLRAVVVGFVVGLAVGFVVGGLAFGVGVAIVGWIVTNPELRPRPVGYVSHTVQTGGRFVGAAMVGVLAGRLVENRGGRIAPTAD